MSQQKTPFICEYCEYCTFIKSNWNLHLTNSKHIEKSNSASVVHKYKCNLCNYETSDDSNFKKHSKRDKHKLNVEKEAFKSRQNDQVELTHESLFTLIYNNWKNKNVKESNLVQFVYGCPEPAHHWNTMGNDTFHDNFTLLLTYFSITDLKYCAEEKKYLFKNEAILVDHENFLIGFYKVVQEIIADCYDIFVKYCKKEKIVPTFDPERSKEFDVKISEWKNNLEKFGKIEDIQFKLFVKLITDFSKLKQRIPIQEHIRVELPSDIPTTNGVSYLLSRCKITIPNNNLPKEFVASSLLSKLLEVINNMEMIEHNKQKTAKTISDLQASLNNKIFLKFRERKETQVITTAKCTCYSEEELKKAEKDKEFLNCNGDCCSIECSRCSEERYLQTCNSCQEYFCKSCDSMPNHLCQTCETKRIKKKMETIELTTNNKDIYNELTDAIKKIRDDLMKHYYKQKLRHDTRIEILSILKYV